MRALPLLLVCLLLAAGCKKPSPPDPKQQAEGLYLKGTAAFLEGRHADAIEAYEQVRKLQPEDPRIDAAEGEVMLVTGRLKEALERFERASKLDPERGATWGRIAFIHEQLGDVEAARKALAKALELNPQDFQSLETLARVELSEGNLDAAVAAYTRAADAIPAPAGAELMLEAATVLTDVKRDADALTLLQEGVTNGHLNGEVARTVGDLQVRAGAMREALDSYQLAAKLQPRDPVPWELVGEIWASLGRYADAKAAYRESLKVQNRTLVHLALVKLALDHGQEEEADHAFAAAQEALTGTPEELLAIADTLERLGRQDDAAAVRQQLAEAEAPGTQTAPPTAPGSPDGKAAGDSTPQGTPPTRGEGTREASGEAKEGGDPKPASPGRKAP